MAEPTLGCVFVQRRRKGQMARPEGPRRCFGYCSFVEERRSESFRLCNALAEEAIKRSAEARSAEALRKGEARRAEPTWHTLHAEARRAEGRGPKGRGEILRVVNLLGNGSEPDSGSPHVIMPKGVSQGTSTSRCRPLTVSVISRHTGVYYLSLIHI